MTTDGSGLNLPGLFASYDRESCLWKTSQGFLFEGLGTFSETWPRWGTMRSGSVYRLRSSVPRIKGKESLLQPGRLVMVWDRSVSCEQEPFLGQVIYHNGDVVDVETPDGFADCFPLEWIHRIPTLGASDYRSGKGYNHGGKLQTPQLRHVMRGLLNPTWCEWLMGFPKGWTDLKHSATRLSRKSQSISAEESCDTIDGRWIEAVSEYASTCDGCGELAMHADLEMDEATQLGYCEKCR